MATNIGTAGSDTIIGKSFAERLFGKGSNDVLKGMGGNDRVYGGSGNDKLYGGRGNDTLIGNSGDDTLHGGSGDDTLIGGAGNDILSGGSGTDRFIFDKGMGKDVITDFDVTKDVLQIPKGMNNISKPLDVLKHATQVGTDVIIKLGPVASIKLKNVTLADLKDKPWTHFDIV